jgi:hypothetical protein
MREYEISVLQAPRTTTDAGVTGAWVDVQGLIHPGGRELKFVLLVGAGATDGTVGGTIQSAEDTSGTGAATVATFDATTSAGAVNTQHGVMKASHRYVRYLGSVQTGKQMIASAAMLGQTRVSP